MTAQTGAMAEALARVATMAGYAPSVHNTQPWKWVVLPERLELFAVRDRQLAVADPEGRLLAISCGAALHHARTALAAVSWKCAVDRVPDPSRPDLLAIVTPTTRTDPGPAAIRLVQQMEIRHTDRRRVSDMPVPDGDLDAIAEAVRQEGMHLHVLADDQVYDLAAAADRAGGQVYDLAAAADRAGAVAQADRATREELAAA